MSSKLFQLYRQYRFIALLVCSVGFLVWLLAYYRVTLGLDRLLFDATQQLNSLPPTEDIVIIDIDDRSINSIGRWPWTRGVHAQLVNQLSLSQNSYVVFDVIFADQDKNNPEADLAFSEALDKHGSVFMPLYIEKVDNQGQMIEVPPAQQFYQSIKGVGHAHVEEDQDGVVRSVYLKEGISNAFWPHISLVLYQIRDNPNLQNIPGEMNLSTENANNPFTIARDYMNLIPMPGAQQGILYYSYVDVLSGQISPAEFDNKVIFIGATTPGLRDFFTTSVGLFPGVELNAWIYHALKHDQLIQKLDHRLNAYINVCLVFALLVYLSRLTPFRFLIHTLGASCLIIFLSMGIQLSANLWLTLVPCLIGIMVFYPLWNWMRLEIAIKFLQREIQNTEQYSLRRDIEQTTFIDAGLHFLRQVGIIENNAADEKDTSQNTKEKKVIHVKKQEGELALALIKPNLEKTIDWTTIVDNRHIEFQRKRRGIELIEQTVSQLISIKRRDAAARKLIRQSLEQLQDAIIIADIGGRISYCNNAFREISAIKADTDSQLLPTLENLELENNQTWIEVFSSLINEQNSLSGSASNKKQNKDLFYQARASKINGDKIDTIILVFTDVTEIKAAEKSRMEALNFLSHDLRSPMVSILAILELHRNQQEVTRDVLDPIEALVRKNLDYAESFVQLSRAEAIQESQLHLCDLHAVLDNAHAHGLALAKPKQIRFSANRIDDDAWVSGHQEMLERAVINLIDNAIKFSPKSASVQLALEAEEQSFKISVIDQGEGIEEEKIPLLFERFSRVGKKTSQPGAGLGLSFVKTVALQHSGKVEVKSEPNKGSQFSIFIPKSEQPG